MNTSSQDAINTLIDKEAIRELAQLYSRGVDRKDAALLRDLYTADATDTHGDTYDGNAEGYVQFLESAFPYMLYSGHHVCNHLIAVDGNDAEGEVYALAYHVLPDGQDGYIEDFMSVRYLDKYRKEEDGKWRFAKRVVTYDFRKQVPIAEHELTLPANPDISYAYFQQRLFATGARSL